MNNNVNPLHGFLIISTDGSVLAASDCYIVNGETIPDHVWDELDAMTDSEAAAVGRFYGRKLADAVTVTPKLPGEI